MSLAKSAGNQASVRAEQRSAGWARYTDSLRYGLHVITHPFDGFWDLIHENGEPWQLRIPFFCSSW